MISRKFDSGDLPLTAAFEKAERFILALRRHGYQLASVFKRPKPGQFEVRFGMTSLGDRSNCCFVLVNPKYGDRAAVEAIP